MVKVEGSQEVVSSNPDTVYWMDVSDVKLLHYQENGENKGSQMGHPQKIFMKNKTK